MRIIYYGESKNGKPLVYTCTEGELVPKPSKWEIVKLAFWIVSYISCYAGLIWIAYKLFRRG